MIYPKFLKKEDLIGISALSSGCELVIPELKRATNHLKEEFNVTLTPNVYGKEIVNVFVIKVNEVMRFLQSLRSEHPTIGGCEGIHRIFSLVSRKRPMAKVGGDAVRHIPTFATTIAKKDR